MNVPLAKNFFPHAFLFLEGIFIEGECQVQMRYFLFCFGVIITELPSRHFSSTRIRNMI